MKPCCSKYLPGKWESKKVVYEVRTDGCRFSGLVVSIENPTRIVEMFAEFMQIVRECD